jgi:Domain of unknown function (DUF5666)
MIHSSTPWRPFAPTLRPGHWARALATALLTAALVGCGGGGSDGTEDSGASASSTQAKAFKGTVTEITGPTTFSVEGIPVDASTTGLPANLAVGTQVKVDGVMSNGVITATKVEFEGAPSSDDSRRPNRIEGRVTTFNSMASFAVNGIPVDASGAERVRGTVALGVFVDVRGIVVNGVLIANRVKVENGNDDGDDDNSNDDSNDDNGVVDELEGTITAFSSNTRFTVGSTPVNASGVGSLPAGLRVGIRVEMDGRLTGGVFVATSLKIDD